MEQLYCSNRKTTIRQNAIVAFLFVIIICFLVWGTTLREAADNTYVKRQQPTTNLAFQAFSKRVDVEYSSQCMLLNNQNFDPPGREIGDYARNGTVVLVGDSVLGQVCGEGRPGLCCNGQVACNVPPRFGKTPTKTEDWSRENQSNESYLAARNFTKGDFLHLTEFIGRGGNYPTVYDCAPNVEGKPDSGLSLIPRFFETLDLRGDSILIVGLFGNHFKDMLKYETFCRKLVTDIMNPFPGKVVVLGASPQHFGENGEYDAQKSWNNKCSPFFPSTKPSLVGLRSSIWTYSVWKFLNHSRAKLIDMQQFLNQNWMCHKEFVHGKIDCTHWNDAIYSVISSFILNALEELE